MQVNLTADKRVNARQVNATIEPQKAAIRAQMKALLGTIEDNRRNCVAWMLVTQCCVDLMSECLEHFNRAFRDASHVGGIAHGYVDAIDKHASEWEQCTQLFQRLHDLWRDTNTTTTLVDEVSNKCEDWRVSDTFANLSDNFNEQFVPQLEQLHDTLKNNDQIAKIFG